MNMLSTFNWVLSGYFGVRKSFSAGQIKEAIQLSFRKKEVVVGQGSSEIYPILLSWSQHQPHVKNIHWSLICEDL